MNTILSPFQAGRIATISPWDASKRLKAERDYAFGNPHERAAVARRFNKASQLFGDFLRDHATRLSSTGAFPDLKNAGLPIGVSFGTEDRMRADVRWAALFRFRDMRGSSTPYFKIADTYNAVTFRVYQLGDEIEIRHVEASESIFELEVIAGGYQYNAMWEMWQDLWNEGEGLAAMQLRWADLLAETAYTTACNDTGISSTPYDTTSGATQVELDINTINTGIVDIKTAMYQATNGSGTIQTKETIEGGAFYLLYNSLTAGYNARVAKALEARLDLPNDNQSVGFVTDPVVPVGSPHIPTGAWYLAVPGRKSVYALGRDLTVSEVTDPRIAGVGREQIGQGSYKLVRGDANQVRKLLLS